MRDDVGIQISCENNLTERLNVACQAFDRLKHDELHRIRSGPKVKPLTANWRFRIKRWFRRVFSPHDVWENRLRDIDEVHEWVVPTEQPHRVLLESTNKKEAKR